MEKQLIARASIRLQARRDQVWEALVTPESIKEYMFGADVVSDWQEGSPIVWKGEWKGQPYEDKGVIRRMEPARYLEYTHFSPLSGLPDEPENYHTVSIDISFEGDLTRVSLTQDNNRSEEERNHSETNWRTMLEAMRTLLEP